MNWGKDKKLLDSSVRLINRFVKLTEAEIHVRYKAKKDSYCRKMIILWEMLDYINKEREYSRHLKNLVSNNPEFAPKLVDNLDEHYTYVIKQNSNGNSASDDGF